jgi:hypothetical protein
MTKFYFNLRDGEAGVADTDGIEFRDESAARAYAVRVASELLRQKDIEKRSWRLEICDDRGGVLSVLPFATVDPSLDHLEPTLRDLIERVSESRRTLSETVFHMHLMKLQLQGRRAHKPYLAAQSGQRI